MNLEILYVPGCPNAAVLDQRLRRAATGQPMELHIAHRVVEDVDRARVTGMAGSPTLLVDGRDPFAIPGQAPSLSCRLYPREDGGLDGAPSVAVLHEALFPLAARS
ncbi:alkylmercury lyase [Nocardia donostiensis]|nr:alkylmercury lyase [Nocardia donostiensis]